jgi:hypothetical protein
VPIVGDLPAGRTSRRNNSYRFTALSADGRSSDQCNPVTFAITMQGMQIATSSDKKMPIRPIRCYGVISAGALTDMSGRTLPLFVVMTQIG